VKQDLAAALVAQFHSPAAADAAAKEFDSVFSSGGTPSEIEQTTIKQKPIHWALEEAGLVSSRNEARRLIEQGAVSVDGETMTSFLAAHDRLAARPEPYLVRVGKRRFARILVLPPS
jgi:tyrosyl-tRNA synthetase